MSCELKARKGLIRASVVVKEGRIADISITGDFMVMPEDVVFRLEGELREVPVQREAVKQAVARALEGASLVGCTIDDFVDVILCATGEQG